MVKKPLRSYVIYRDITTMGDMETQWGDPEVWKRLVDIAVHYDIELGVIHRGLRRARVNNRPVQCKIFDRKGIYRYIIQKASFCGLARLPEDCDIEDDDEKSNYIPK